MCSIALFSPTKASEERAGKLHPPPSAEGALQAAAFGGDELGESLICSFGNVLVRMIAVDISKRSCQPG